ncbi:flagellar hook-length control protein FliK [uncultured Cohaesibacter sp.]|uniref:flagellar hook-length control protein FliK n=1 Tax=uncultured Cohaesibacter sp. TaxID=1002546 RepID=UPI0029C8B981|nr:flagellar hook-length control protein FliK [uncultured Cohaesibacter sp.]
MAMDIVRAGFTAQTTAINNLLKALGDGQTVQGRLQAITKLPTGEAQLRVQLAGQVLDVKADPAVASQLKAGSPVFVQVTQTYQGPQLTIRPMPTSGEGQGQPIAPPSTSSASTSGSAPASSPPQPSPLQSAATMARPDGYTPAKNVPSLANPAYSARPTATAPVSQTPIPAPLVALQRQAMVQQRSLTELFTNLTAFVEQVEGGARPGVSPDLVATMRWVLGFQLTSERSPKGDKAETTLRQLISSLGLLGQHTSGTHESALATNLKTALSLLQSLLPDDGDMPLPPKAQPSALTTQGTNRDLPPLKGAPLEGQAARLPTFLASDSNQVALSHVKSAVEAALARITLSQIASLRSASADQPSSGGHAVQTLHAEIPVAVANGTAIVQMTIQQDPTSPFEEGNEEPTQRGDRERVGWIVHFAVDTEPVGTVSAVLQLRGQSVRLTLGASRAETLEIFEHGTPLLQAMLDEEGLTLAGLVFKRQKNGTADQHMDIVPSQDARLDRKL